MVILRMQMFANYIEHGIQATHGHPLTLYPTGQISSNIYLSLMSFRYTSLFVMWMESHCCILVAFYAASSLPVSWRFMYYWLARYAGWTGLSGLGLSHHVHLSTTGVTSVLRHILETWTNDMAFAGLSTTFIKPLEMQIAKDVCYSARTQHLVCQPQLRGYMTTYFNLKTGRRKRSPMYDAYDHP